jgi:trans-aconitate 2-methyltransferase
VAGSGDWNATTYDRVSDPQARWGAAVLERLPLVGDETVLDAGCGSGRVTELLAERLPNGHVVALDASTAMLEEAARRLARFGSSVTFVGADLEQPLPAAIPPVDAILSTAVFHWIRDHEALFRHLAAVLRRGGRLVAQCGGAGNVRRFSEVVARVTGRGGIARTFETPETTEQRLAAAGFTNIRCWLSDAPTRFEPGEPFEAFLETVCLRDHVAGLAPEARRKLARSVAAQLGEPLLDYVRLNIDAVRA